MFHEEPDGLVSVSIKRAISFKESERQKGHTTALRQSAVEVYQEVNILLARDCHAYHRPHNVGPVRTFLSQNDTWPGSAGNYSSDRAEVVTADGESLAKAKTTSIAEDIADRLNEDDMRKEEDKWSA